MKKLRPDAFDPKLSSPLDAMPAIEKPGKKKTENKTIANELKDSPFFQPVKEANKVPVVPPAGDATQERKQPIQQLSKQEILLAINIAILQTEIEQLMKDAYKSQTFRFTPEELKKLRDLSYSLSNALDKKITQGDLLRVGLLLLQKHLEDNNESMMAVLKEMK